MTRRALVLSGGGARGAYEAGVLRYLIEALPRVLGRTPQLDILCGTSVGAIHIAWLAATAHLGAERAERLAAIWGRMQLGEIFTLSGRELLRLPRRLFGMVRGEPELRHGRLPARLHGMLDTDPLERIVLEEVPWRQIRPNVRRGLIHAACVAATQISTGRVVVFTEHQTPGEVPWTVDPSVVVRPTRLGPHHALASAAIPVLFPAVRVEDTYYADGGLRLNTPLAPALRLGADRVLVVALRHGVLAGEDAALAERRVAAYGNPIFLVGKVLNALLLDHVDTDLAHMRLINDILEAGELSYGSGFLDHVNDVVEKRRGQRFRVVHDLVIRPSEDLGRVAAEVLDAQRREGRLATLLRVLIGAVGLPEQPLEADLLSYLLFDRDYTARLLALGWSDAQAHEAELVRFFTDDAETA